MTAPAPRVEARWSSRSDRSGITLALKLLVGICLVAPATPAAAQAGVSISLLSDYRFRGYSYSQGRPIAAINFSYDRADGLYMGLSASGVLTRSDGVSLLGLQENVGFAKRLKSGLTVDAGFTNANYTRYSNGVRAFGYAEVYVGLLGKHVASHVYFSPNYITSGTRSIYAEVDGVVRPAPHWRFNWHVGGQALRSERRHRNQFDWRIGLTREIGSTDVQLAVSRGERRVPAQSERRPDRTAVVVAVTHAF